MTYNLKPREMKKVLIKETGHDGTWFEVSLMDELGKHITGSYKYFRSEEEAMDYYNGIKKDVVLEKTLIKEDVI